MSAPDIFEPQILHLVRFTLEAISPLSLGSGSESENPDKDKRSDVGLARDANGLPTIPGSSLQGVLRHLWPDRDEAGNLFGHEEQRENGGRAGRLAFDFGAVHDSGNAARRGRIGRREIEGDPLLNALARPEPLLRHHVKLTHRSVADGCAKFDRSAVPAGTRFSFELAMWGEQQHREEDRHLLARLLGLLGHPLFRLGGASRRGYGRMKCKAHSYAAGSDPAKIRAWREQPASTALADTLPVTEEHECVTATLTLTPSGPWRIGWRAKGKAEIEGRAATLGALDGFGKPAGSWNESDRPDPRKVASDEALESLPLHEPRIVWNGDDATVEDALAENHTLAIPGSALRGPLAHRALFHWNAAKGNVIDAEADTELGPNSLDFTVNPTEFAALFGAAKQGVNTGDGQAGALFIDDGAVTDIEAVQYIAHSSIDRFTGGVRSGVLFGEEVVHGGTITFKLCLAQGIADRDVRESFLKALRDLTQGRLAIGAKSRGFATGKLEWTDSRWQGEWEALP